MMFTWIAFGASLFIVLTLGGKVGWEVTYPVVILLYGIGTFISGGVLRFLPLILGGIACWVISCIAFFVSFDIQLLLLAGSLLVAYIIPGHLLKYNYNRNV
jgi:hypothetical protein